jgi:hypothetical protein
MLRDSGGEGCDPCRSCRSPRGLYFIEDLANNRPGDGRTGCSAVDHVLNARRVLRGYADHGSFAEPHALQDPDRLSQLVDTVSFYCPRVVMERGGGLQARLPGRQGWRPRFLAGQEELCVLRRTPR